MGHHRGTLWKGLVFLVVLFMLGGLCLGGAGLFLGMNRYRMARWSVAPEAETYRGPVGPMMHGWGSSRLWGLPFLCGLKALFHVLGLVLIAGLILRLFRHRRCHAWGGPMGCGPGDKQEHPHHGPHGHWHHMHPCCCWYHEHEGAKPEADQAQPDGSETQDFKVG